jgi:hypothetical protein
MRPDRRWNRRFSWTSRRRATGCNLTELRDTETSAANADYKKVWDSIQAFRNDEYLWWQVAEYTYDTFMIRTRTRT